MTKENVIVFATFLGYLNGQGINYIYDKTLYVQENFIKPKNG